MSAYDQIPRHLADNIASLRKAKGLSQDQLARLAEIPRSTLTHIESGSGNPSLLNLARVSQALQVSVEELLTRPRLHIELRRERELTVQTRGQGRVKVFKLLPDKVKGLDVDRFEMEPQAVMGGHPHLSGAKEYLTVLSGEITVSVAGERHRVRKGDVLAFPGDQPHAYHNTGAGKASAMSVVIPVVF